MLSRPSGLATGPVRGNLSQGKAGCSTTFCQWKDGSGSTIKEGSYVCSGLRYWQPQFHLRWFMARAPKIRMALSTRPRTCKALRRRQPRLTCRMRILLTCPTEALTDVIGSNQPLTHTESLVNG